MLHLTLENTNMAKRYGSAYCGSLQRFTQVDCTAKQERPSLVKSSTPLNPPYYLDGHRRKTQFWRQLDYPVQSFSRYTKDRYSRA